MAIVGAREKERVYVKEHVGGRLSRYFRVRCFSANVSGAVVHKFSPNDTGAQKEGGRETERSDGNSQRLRSTPFPMRHDRVK